MPTLKDLEASPGELILPKWKLLLEWAEGLKVIPHPGVLVTSGPAGTIVKPTTKRGWPHPFRVGLSGFEVRVGEGLLDGERVMMAGGFLDGMQSDGVTPNSKGRPTLELKDRPDRSDRSWIALFPPEGEGKEAAPEVRHVVKLSGECQPIAVITWEGDRPLRKFQIVHHNLSHARSATVEGRVFFWAV